MNNIYLCWIILGLGLIVLYQMRVISGLKARESDNTIAQLFRIDMDHEKAKAKDCAMAEEREKATAMAVDREKILNKLRRVDGFE